MTIPSLRSSACLSLAIAALALYVPAHAESQFDEDFDDTSKALQEIAVQLPRLPATIALMPFDVSATATQTFGIARDTLTVGADGVIRYVMVSRSASGAENISYEGLRCASLEKKLYAFGHKDGSWSRSRRDRWEPISGNAANRPHAALAGDYFCDGNTVAGNAASILRRLDARQSLVRHLAQ